MNYIHCLEIEESTIQFAKELSIKNKNNVGIISPAKILTIKYKKEKESVEKKKNQQKEKR